MVNAVPDEKWVFQKTEKKHAGDFDDLLFKLDPLWLCYPLEALRNCRKERKEKFG